MPTLGALFAQDSSYELLPTTPTTSTPRTSECQPWYRAWSFTLLGTFFFLSGILVTLSQPHRTTAPFSLKHAPVALQLAENGTTGDGAPALNTRLVEALFPVESPYDPHNPHLFENRHALHALVACVAAGTCAANQTSVVLLASPHFGGALAGLVSGEDIWAASVIKALRSLGYTLFFVRCCTGQEGAFETILPIYRQFPGLVKAILLDGNGPVICASRADCIQSPSNPTGLPLEKLLAFYFWSSPAHPLGGAWTLAPYDYAHMRSPGAANHTFLGYSVEENCRLLPFVPHAEREERAYVLGKLLRYFLPAPHGMYAWPGADFAALGLRAVAGAIAGHPSLSLDMMPGGIENLGKLTKARFYAELGRSRVLVGVGESPMSPSPLDALCMGVPFVNPIASWDAADPEDRSRWYTQHNGLNHVREPYVYHVRHGDLDGLGRALRKAARTPIDSYILPEMTEDALRVRVSEIVERDWTGLAERRVAELGWDGALPLSGACAEDVRQRGYIPDGHKC